MNKKIPNHRWGSCPRIRRVYGGRTVLLSEKAQTAMAFNRLADAKIDAANPRTRTRALLRACSHDSSFCS